MQRLIWYSIAPMMWMIAASCGYPALPRLSEIDAAGSDVPVDAAGSDVPVDASPQFLSCAGLAATCGAAANANCCQVAMVPGGSFYRSYDGAGYNDMGYPATMSTFVLDTYEVTVGRFRVFVNAGMGTQASPPEVGTGTHPNLAGSGWDSTWNTSLVADMSALISAIHCDSTYQAWTDAPGANENKPMNCVSWYEAMAFCIWDGGYLPTESEWNYAASGGSDQRAYPWSKNPASSMNIDCGYANYFINNPSGTFCANGATGGTSKVGSEAAKGDARWGHSDLAGNVSEWTLDKYASAYLLPCNDCANLANSTNRVFRGGNFSNGVSPLRASARGFNSPFSRDFGVGLRCARRAP